MPFDFCQQGFELLLIKLPLKESWILIIQFFIEYQAETEGIQIGKVIGGKHLALND